MSTRRLLIALSNGYPFPLRLSMYYHSNLGGYLYTPDSQGENPQYECDPIFKFIRYFNKNYGHGVEHCPLQYGDFTLYIWNNDVEVYIDIAIWDDGNIGIYGHDESDNEYSGTIYMDYGETNLGDDIYMHRPGEIYMYQSN